MVSGTVRGQIAILFVSSGHIIFLFSLYVFFSLQDFDKGFI